MAAPILESYKALKALPVTIATFGNHLNPTTDRSRSFVANSRPKAAGAREKAGTLRGRKKPFSRHRIKAPPGYNVINRVRKFFRITGRILLSVGLIFWLFGDICG